MEWLWMLICIDDEEEVRNSRNKTMKSKNDCTKLSDISKQ